MVHILYKLLKITQNIIVAPNLILFGSVRITQCSKVVITVSSESDIPWLL